MGKDYLNKIKTNYRNNTQRDIFVNTYNKGFIAQYTRASKNCKENPIKEKNGQEIWIKNS